MEIGDTADDLLDMIWGMQSKRMDEQRASLPEPSSPDDQFFDMLMRCQVSLIATITLFHFLPIQS